MPSKAELRMRHGERWGCHNLASDAGAFPQDVIELMDHLADSPRRQVRAVPGAGLKMPVWILGSSLFGAQLVAALGLPYAFASHFAPPRRLRPGWQTGRARS